MSSSTLGTIQTQLNLYAYPFFMIFGSIGNVFILILLSRRRQNACSIYLISSAIMNILYLLTDGFFRIFAVYNDGTIRAIILCKMSNYIPTVTGQVTKTMVVLACIDRYLVQSCRPGLLPGRPPGRPAGQAEFLKF